MNEIHNDNNAIFKHIKYQLVRFEILTVVNVVITFCCLPEGEDSKVGTNTGTSLPDYTASHPRRQ
jgi:hypothetical protein